MNAFLVGKDFQQFLATGENQSQRMTCVYWPMFGISLERVYLKKILFYFLLCENASL